MKNLNGKEKIMKFEKKDTKELAQKLFESITTGHGFNALSKTDLYDYVLYLLDKYCDEPFLFTKSNQENALLLRVKPEKVKSSKFNIYFKLLDEDEKKEIILNFISLIVTKPNVIRDYEDEKKKSRMSITIEDPIVRFWLDGKMKAEIGTSPDTSFNREIIDMEKKDFFKVLWYFIEENKSSIKDEFQKEMKAGIKSIERKEDIKVLFNFLLGGTMEVVDKLNLLPVDTIKDALGIVYQIAVKAGKAVMGKGRKQ